MNNSSDLSAKLKEARQKKGLSQNTVAEMLNVSRQAVSRWETGKGSPDINTLPMLSELYDVSIDELFGHETSVSENQSQNIEKEMSHLDETSPEIAETAKKTASTHSNLPHASNIFNQEHAILILLLVLSSFVTFAGLIASLYIFIWTWRNRRHYKLVLILAIICILIGLNHLYIFAYTFLPSSYISTIEKVS